MDISRLTVNCSILLTDYPLLQRPRAAKAAGFEAVEFWWPFPEAVPTDGAVDEFIRAVDDAGVRLTHLNLAAGDLAAGHRGLLSDPATTREFRNSIDVAVGIGERLGTVGFNALYGNRTAGLTAETQDELAAENLAVAARAAARIGAQILIEPLSGIPTYPITRAAQAIDICERVQLDHGVTNIALLADLYHLAVNGENLDDVIDSCATQIGHVQIADAPGRGEPGTGSLDFARYLTRLTAQDYPGWISLEYAPTRSDPFDWVKDYPA